MAEVPGFSGAESAKPLPAHGFEGVERQAWGPVLMGWTAAGLVPQWQPVVCGFFWMVVASLGHWLPDGGRGGVILEGAAVGDFPVQLVASSSSGDNTSSVPWILHMAWRVLSEILTCRACFFNLPNDPP